ncbi:MAG: class I SAM-dependent methyltransferase [Deltaproteobacteria bacterium]|nr:class I SAM-dependent methyltransferase [Deltaproteobacteria bacterium]
MRALTLAFSCMSLACAGESPAAFRDTRAEVAAVLAASERDAKDLERDARDRRVEALGLAGLAPGMRVLDVFSGGGYFAEIAARVVGESGKVYAHNNRAYLSFAGEALEARRAARPPGQLVRLDREIDGVGLAGEIDLALIVMAYHDAYWQPKPEEGEWTVTRDPLMQAIFDALRPGGRLLVVDHAAANGSGSSAAQDLHRIDEAFARADFERAGFRFVASSDALRNASDDRTANVFDPAIRGKTDRFALLFEKPASR